MYQRNVAFITPNRLQSKMLILSTNVDQKTLETEFLIVICRQRGDNWRSKLFFLSKTMFLVIFYLCMLIVKSAFDCHLSGVFVLQNDNERSERESLHQIHTFKNKPGSSFIGRLRHLLSLCFTGQQDI